MKHEDLHTSIKVIDRELRLLKDACGIHDDEADSNAEEAGSKADEARPRKRGRHLKGMPEFKKGDKDA